MKYDEALYVYDSVPDSVFQLYNNLKNSSQNITLFESALNVIEKNIKINNEFESSTKIEQKILFDLLENLKNDNDMVIAGQYFSSIKPFVSSVLDKYDTLNNQLGKIVDDQENCDLKLVCENNNQRLEALHETIKKIDEQGFNFQHAISLISEAKGILINKEKIDSNEKLSQKIQLKFANILSHASSYFANNEIAEIYHEIRKCNPDDNEKKIALLTQYKEIILNENNYRKFNKLMEDATNISDVAAIFGIFKYSTNFKIKKAIELIAHSTNYLFFDKNNIPKDGNGWQYWLTCSYEIFTGGMIPAIKIIGQIIQQFSDNQQSYQEIVLNQLNSINIKLNEISSICNTIKNNTNSILLGQRKTHDFIAEKFYLEKRCAITEKIDSIHYLIQQKKNLDVKRLIDIFGEIITLGNNYSTSKNLSGFSNNDSVSLRAVFDNNIKISDDFEGIVFKNINTFLQRYLYLSNQQSCQRIPNPNVWLDAHNLMFSFLKKSENHFHINSNIINKLVDFKQGIQNYLSFTEDLRGNEAFLKELLQQYKDSTKLIISEMLNSFSGQICKYLYDKKYIQYKKEALSKLEFHEDSTSSKLIFAGAMAGVYGSIGASSWLAALAGGPVGLGIVFVGMIPFAISAKICTQNENEIVKNYINNDFNSLNSKSQIEFMLSKLNNTLYNEINIKLWKYLGSSNFEEKINNLHKQFMIILSYYKIAFPNNDYIMKMLVNDLSFAERINLAQIKLQNSTTENIKDNLTVFFNEIKKCYDSNSIIENKLINPLNDLVKNGNNATLIKAVQNLKKYTRVADMLLHRKIKRDFSNNNYMFHSYKSPNNYKPSNYKITSDSWYNNAIIEKLLEKYINQEKFEVFTPILATNRNNINDLNDALKDHLNEVKNNRRVHKDILIPCNTHQNHWVLIDIVFNKETKDVTVNYFDPLGGAIHQDIENAVKENFGNNVELGARIDFDDSIQQDGYNCGPWIVEAAILISKNSNIDGLKNININEKRNKHAKYINQLNFDQVNTNDSNVENKKRKASTEIPRNKYPDNKRPKVQGTISSQLRQNNS